MLAIMYLFMLTLFEVGHKKDACPGAAGGGDDFYGDNGGFGAGDGGFGGADDGFGDSSAAAEPTTGGWADDAADAGAADAAGAGW